MERFKDRYSWLSMSHAERVSISSSVQPKKQQSTSKLEGKKQVNILKDNLSFMVMAHL